MLNSLAAKLRHKLLYVKGLNVKFYLDFLQIFASFVKNFLHCEILIKNNVNFCLIL